MVALRLVEDAPPDGVLQRALNSRPVLVPVHIYKIDNNYAAYAPQPELPRYLARRLQIGFQNGVLQPVVPGKFPGIHIYNRKRLRLVYYKISSAVQPNPAFKQPVQLAVKIIV